MNTQNTTTPQDINVTDLEKKVLEGINNSDFGEELGDPIWAGTENCSVPTSQVRGVLSSLVKKGLVFISDAGTKDATYYITKEGLEVCHTHNLLGKYSKC